MANNIIPCGSNKTKLIDPNDFGGQDSSTNISVPLEDLTISVELNTRKRARTILTTTQTGGSTGNSQGAVTVNFIGGEKQNGSRVLTTAFTDLTTTFNDENVSQNLGITNIDIDFNSSYAPMITINFIDVKGSAIFQNEETIGDNKYSVFFELPYPLYNLTIKGYYGQPVSYCLHMTKYTSRFNTQTGNFEITASFIGYTYAILSDMLLGFLKAIEYTNLGNSKYKELKLANSNLLTLDDLYEAVSNINNTVKKLLSSDFDAAQLAKGELSLKQLDSILFEIGQLGQGLDYTSLVEYEFIIIDPTKELDPTNKSMDNYNINVTKYIKDYNSGTTFTLNLSDFTSLNTSNKYNDITIVKLKDNDPTLQQTFNTLGPDIDKTIKKLYNYVTSNERINNSGFSDVTPFNIYDLRNLYKKINEAKGKIIDEQEKLKKSLAITLRQVVRSKLGFDPTVRNIINVFTTAVEVFLYVLFEVSKQASQSTDRTNELKKAFKILDNSDYTTIDNPIFYPWPDYRKDSDVDGLVEEYLGKYGVLDTPSSVTELEFIDNLLNAFLTQAQNQAEIDQLLLEAQQNWMPVNPVDTRLFDINSFPYQRIEGINLQELKTLILIRAMTFMGLSNRKLSEPEIQKMAEFEANGIVSDITSASIIDSLKNELGRATTPDAINTLLTGVKGRITNPTISTTDVPLLKVVGDTYVYDYIYNGNPSNERALPINDKFYDSEWFSSFATDYANDGSIFLTNYQETSGGELKPVDGGKYISFIEPIDYDDSNNALTLVSPVSTTQTIDLSELSQTFDKVKTDFSKVGFDASSGVYGVQEFRQNLNYNKAELDGLPFRYMFYADTGAAGTSFFGLIDGTNYYNKTSSFANKRTAGVIANPPPYDKFIFPQTPKNTFTVANDPNSILNFIDGKDSVHKDYGNFRLLANKYRTNPNDITFPYINFNVQYNNAYDGGKLAPVSLFGSRLYYEQTTQEARAFLFLHTLPWNGLSETISDGLNTTIFDKAEILNTFAHRAGFVSAPYLWAAFIGGLLWRADTNENTVDPLKFHSTGINAESFIPTFGTKIDPRFYPKRDEYLITTQSNFSLGYYFRNTSITFSNQSTLTGSNYKSIDKVLLNLPDQAKTEFIDFFKKFVNTDWVTLKDGLEIYDNLSQNLSWTNVFTQTINSLILPDIIAFPLSANTNTINSIYGYKDNFNNYMMMTPIAFADINNNLVTAKENDIFKNNIFLELRDDAPIVNTLIGLINKEIIIANTSYKIWKTDPSTTDARGDISVKKSDLTIYLSKLNEVLNNTTSNNIKKQQEQAIFGTSDENIIKLMLYRTCKNIYDKWIGETNNSDEIIFRCGGRNEVDTKLAKNRGESTPKLIDSFRFVTRSFRDIGDELAINPTPVIEYLRDNPNSSFYDAVTNLLSSNNFDFIPLPSFINYRDEKQLTSVFKPFSNYDTDTPTAGPSFVCVYLGQKSKHLAIYKNDITYPNDGFDISCNGQTIQGLPADFNKPLSDYEDPVTFFNVNFGQQNQNIFKDITLDQSEFGETAESLQIIDDISRKGTETNRTLAGQNLYNVYSVRSYKVEVEMLGDAMIQPMMYFQLNNIPMFHGAYMITHVKHNIKPNHMSTHFTGVRLRKPETQIFGVGDLFMSLLDTLENTNPNNAQTGYRFGESPGQGSIGGNCGKYTPPTITGDENYYNSKPIRDIVAAFESSSSGLYDAYNSGTAGQKIGNFKPSTMTIGEIKTEQTNGNILAVGKYQLIPGTFSTMVRKLGFADTDIFNADKQEKAGEWLILKGAGYREGLRDYFSDTSDGNELDLQNAITDLALEFASLPTYHLVDMSNGKKIGVIGYNSNQLLYGGTGGNAAVNTKLCAQDVAKALIDTWKRLYPSKTIKFDYDKITTLVQQNNIGCGSSQTQAQTLKDTSKSIIMGDSTIGVLLSAGLKPTTTKIDIAYNCVGKDVAWLNKELAKDTKKYNSVERVFVSIGTNEGYATSPYEKSEITKLDKLIIEKFPNVKHKIVVPGTFGWDNVKTKTKTDQDTYYNIFKGLGWIYIYPNASASFSTVALAHDPKQPFFKELVTKITEVNNNSNPASLGV